MKKIIQLLAPLILGAMAISSASQAGGLYLTGHDVLLHDGQVEYDNTILNYLKGARKAADYKIGLVRGNSGFVGSVGVNTLEGFGLVKVLDLNPTPTAAAFSAFLKGIDVLVIPSHTSCGGCDLSTADADILSSFSAEIEAFFNGGGDIFANSGAMDSTFYDFLPPSILGSAPSIFGSFGFIATMAGSDIGITDDQINGFATHNRFVDFDSDFTVFETHNGDVISIGIRDAFINEDDINVGCDFNDPNAIIGTPGNDTLLGTPGDDVIFGLGGNDTIFGYGGNDCIDGGEGNDKLLGGPGNDRIFGDGDDDDLVHGNGGDDQIFGGAGNDKILGGAGNDMIGGGSGDDQINGNPGDDQITGGSGDDSISGSSGDDDLDGGLGEDEILGGPGSDVCVDGETIDHCEI
jgi:Ca2+-binding RTX toxin-like protein